MKRITPLVFATIALAALSACVQPANELPSRAHTDRIMRHDFNWTSGLGGVEFVMSVQNVAGKTAVCGTQFQTGVSTAKLNTRVMADYTLMMDGKRLIEGFTFFKRVNTSEELRTTPANCRDTGLPWSDSYMTADADLTGSKRGY